MYLSCSFLHICYGNHKYLDSFPTRRSSDLASCGVAKSSVQLRVAVIGMIPPHTEHRARIPGPGTRAGSTRKTEWQDRKSTRLNSSHLVISYAVFCLKKKKAEYFIYIRV